jgi:SAM-dependent methyltransferase
VIARGYDFEYATSPGEFSARRCRACGNVYLNPRPDVSQFERIYPSEYHSLDFSEESFSLVHRVRSRLEANRLLRYCAGAPADARILDVGCGDAFHLKLLRRYGKPGWTLEGVDIDARAVEIAARSGIMIHQGTVEDLDLGEDRYDVVYTIRTIEHVARPDRVLAAINRVLKPGGRLVIVTDNTESVDARWFRRRYWGGYHFPRHWNLFNQGALTRLAVKSGFASERIDTIVSPVNWVYSVHNLLVGKGAPRWLIDRFTLKSPIALAVFTVVDAVLQRTGRGALLNAFFTKPSR